MKIAIDLEEVLADTIKEACLSTDKLEPNDFESWELSDHTWQVYSGVSDALWRHDALSIAPVENDLSSNTKEMKESVDQLDVVTARLHVDPQIENWLNYYNIKYDSIVSTREPKYQLGYDVYIDDNPEMHGECRLLLRDHPHNQAVDDNRSKATDRIESLSEAVAFL